MCGGTFASRNRKKRKIKSKITSKEQKERRIRRKFGTNGVTLGADEEQKVKLEKGKRPAGKPRVAGSARGRELRAAAALSRFEVQKDEPQIKDQELVTDSEAESEAEEEFCVKPELTDAVDIDGIPLRDLKGGGMVRVCNEEDDGGEDAKRELSDFRSVTHAKPLCPTEQTKAIAQPVKTPTLLTSEPPRSLTPSAFTPKPPPKIEDRNIEAISARGQVPATACSLCSAENEGNAVICIICSNVLRPELVADFWRCKSSTWSVIFSVHIS